ncbi:hypothetical protein [Geotalea sp. SG265]|uniref:hypothetical protein n=1 Tax=Geotalea sp. SG265 TaxID=2922867 RepID=UPI001FAF74BB|nr:hypothetical protein [Geotalea sp. SG265]
MESTDKTNRTQTFAQVGVIYSGLIFYAAWGYFFSQYFATPYGIDGIKTENMSTFFHIFLLWFAVSIIAAIAQVYENLKAKQDDEDYEDED